MALSNLKNIDGAGKNLYYKILNLCVIEDNYEIYIGIFNSKKDAKNMVNMIGYGVRSFIPDNSDENLIKQAYKYLKHEDDFKYFIDV